MNDRASPTAAAGSQPLRPADVLAVAAIVAAALLLRTVPLTFSHFWDETVFLQHARVFVDGRTNYNEFSSRPPVLPMLYAAGFLIHDSLYVANVVQGIVTALGVLFAFLYARRALGRVPALVAAALLAFTPYIVDASHDLLTDMPAITFMLAAMWAFERPGLRAAVLSGIAFGLAVETRFTSLFLGLYIVLQSLVVHRRLWRLAWWGAGAAAALAPYLVWARVRYGDFLYPFAFARRVVTEWTAPVPARFYAEALVEIFPSGVWVLFAAGVVAAVWQWRVRVAGALAPAAPAERMPLQVAVLCAWGLAFVAYMVSIGHKEVRYLLPVAIPVTMVAAVGAAALLRHVVQWSRPAHAIAAVVVAAVAALQFSAPWAKLGQPWVDRTVWDGAVEIGLFLRQVAAPGDVVYAAHEYPVLAFYSERKTVTLLPIQESFAQSWRETMQAPGWFVYFPPASITETHSRDPSFKPDQAFIDAHPEFQPFRTFRRATVYRYTPGR